MKIHKLKPPKTKSSPDVISCLQEALKMARENKVISLAIVVVADNDQTLTDYCIEKNGSLPDLIGTIERVKYRIIKRWVEQ